MLLVHRCGHVCLLCVPAPAPQDDATLTSKALVEDTSFFKLYQAFFMIVYFCVSFVCGRIVITHWLEAKKMSLSNNKCVRSEGGGFYVCVLLPAPLPLVLLVFGCGLSALCYWLCVCCSYRYQVLFCLSLGAFVRAIGFLKNPCGLDEVRSRGFASPPAPPRPTPPLHTRTHTHTQTHTHTHTHTHAHAC